MTTPTVLASGLPLVFGGCQGFTPIEPHGDVDFTDKATVTAVDISLSCRNGAMLV